MQIDSDDEQTTRRSHKRTASPTTAPLQLTLKRPKKAPSRSLASLAAFAASSASASPSPSAETLQQQGDALAQGGHFEEAIAAWKQALLLAPSWVLHEQLAQAYLELGRTFDAVQAAHAAVDANAQSAEALRTLARAQLNHGEFRMAADSLARALHLDPSLADGFAELAHMQAIVRQGDERAQLVAIPPRSD